MTCINKDHIAFMFKGALYGVEAHFLSVLDFIVSRGDMYVMDTGNAQVVLMRETVTGLLVQDSSNVKTLSSVSQ